MTFQDLGLIAPILRALADQGYERPSPIQAGAIPPALAGRDVLGCAQTGTGKTCAFAAPILQRLSGRKAAGRPIRALILTPTRELAIQIGESFDAYGKNLSLRTAVIFGGVGQNPQVEQLRRGVDILVATPGRLGDLYQQKLLDLSNIEIFVLDEADRMLDMGFIHDVKKILKWLPDKKQTLFFSATMPPEITQLVNSLLHDPARVAVDPISSPVEIIDQSVYFVDRGNKTKLLALLVEQMEVTSALVFTRTKHGANKVARDLEKCGIAAAAIHGNKSQTARQQALADFKAGKVRVLVATDIAARGLDIEDLSHVFNYNLPDVPETYVHRIGRTGRAGKGGAAIALCDFSEQPLLRDIEKLIGKKVPVVDGHPWPMEVFEAAVKDKKGRIVNAEDAEARAAAKERRRARDAEAKAAAQARKEKAARAEQPVVPPEPPPAEETGQSKKRRKKKKKAESPAHQAAPVQESVFADIPDPMPQPAALRTERPKLVRPGVRFDTGDQMPVTEFQRPDPLAGDRIMDATARLLAPRRPLRPDPILAFREEPKQKKDGKKQTGTPAQPAPQPQEGAGKKKNRKKKKTADALQTPAPAQPVQGEPETKPAKAKKKKKAKAKPAAQPVQVQQPQPTQTGQEGAKRRKVRERRPPEPAGRSRTKDSTQQKSLMRPYYLSDDK